MNIELLTKVADWLEKGGRADTHFGVPKFNMTYFYQTSFNCGTVCCIAGAAALMSGKHIKINRTLEMHDITYILDLKYDKAYDLVYAEKLFEEGGAFYGRDKGLKDIHPLHAAAVIRNLLATGKVDWNVGSHHS